MSFKEEQQAKLDAMVAGKKGKERDDILANVVKSSKRTFQSGTPENKKMKKEIEDYKKLDMLPPPPLVVQSTGQSSMYIDKMSSVMEDKQSREIDRNITSAGFGQKSLAVASAFAQGSSVGNAINKFYELNMTEEARNVDKEFKSSINTTFIQDYMAGHGIPNKEKYFELLLGANNKEHLAKISDFIQTDMYMEQTISNSITPLANVSARFVGEMTTHPLSAIATLPTVIPRALVMAKGAQSTLATLGSSVGISYIGMKATEYGDPSTTSDDFYLGLGVGALADLASTKIMYNKYKAQDDFRAMVESNIKNSVEATYRVDEAMKYFNPNKHDISTDYKWSTNKETIAKQEVDSATNFAQAEKTRIEQLKESVAGFTPRKETTASIMSKLGLDDNGYAEALSTAQKDTDEILSMIRGEAQGNVSVAGKNLTEIITIAKAIGDVAPHLETKIMKEIGKAIDNPISQTGKKKSDEVSGKTKEGISFKIGKGKQRYEETSRKMDEVIAKQAKEEKKQFVKEARQSKTKIEAKQEVLNELGKIQKSLVKEEAKLTAMKGSRATSKAIAKQEDIVAKLLDDEAEAISKTDTFAKTASTVGSESLARQKEMYQRMASAMDEIVYDMSQELNTRILDDVIDDASKENLAKNLSDDLSEGIGQEVKVTVEKTNDITDSLITVSGKVELPVENGYVKFGKNKVLLATAIATVGASGAMADDGGSITVGGFATFLLAAIAGTAFVKTIKENPSIVTSMLNKGKEAKAVETMAKIESDPIVKERKAWSQKAFDFFKTGYISSYFTTEKYGSKFAKDLLSKLVENPSEFAGVPADVLKGAELKTALGRIHVAEAENFKAFIQESEISSSILDTVSNLGAETNALENFRLKVSDAIDNPSGSHFKSVIEQAKIYRKELDQAFDSMVANGVYGIDEATKLKNYFPRYIRGSNIVSITSTQQGMDGLISAISLMVKDATGKPQAQADKWADIWVKNATKIYKGSNLSSKEADRFLNAMTEFGIDMKGISKEDIMMAASNSSDVMSRIKSRLPMKMSSFNPFKATIDGVETTIHAEDIFMRNSNDVVKKYLNESYGQIALKQALGDSYTSESALRAVINEETNQEVRDVLNMYVSALTGKPLYDANTVMNRNIDIAKNLSYGKLLLATASMTPEIIKATSSIMLHSDTFSQGVKELRNIFRDIPSNTLLSEELSYSIMGTGTSSAIKEGSFKGIDSFTNINEDVGGIVGRIGNANKSTSLWLSRLIQADDAVKRIASIHNVHRLLDLANNKSTMSTQRMSRYGITPQLLATVKNNVKVDANGNILTIDWNTWKQSDKNTFRAVLHQMNQQRSIEVMIGGIPKASLNNPAGRLLSFLSSFTAQMYSTHFVGMFKSLDQEEMFNQITWMVGGMMTALAKDSISGREKEITDEELVIRTIQSSPAVAPYSLVKLFSDPISLQTGADAIQEVNNLGSIATKD